MRPNRILGALLALMCVCIAMIAFFIDTPLSPPGSPFQPMVEGQLPQPSVTEKQDSLPVNPRRERDAPPQGPTSARKRDKPVVEREAEPQPPPPEMLTTRSKSNVRAAPSLSAAKVHVLAKGTTVTLIAQEGRWRQVRYGDITGWVREDNFIEP